MPRAPSFLLLCTLALASSCGDEAPDPVSARPGVWFVSIDTLRWDALGCSGTPGAAATPNLDALARAGSFTSRGRAHVPLTLPSHGTMMTGLLPPRLGVHDNAPFSIGAGPSTLAEQLRDAGWHTAAVVGGRPLARGCGLERGFDDYLDPPPTERGRALFGERRAEEIADLSIERVLAAADRPTLLWSHFFDPHFPYAPPPGLASGSSARERYLGEVHHVDRQIGRVLDALRRTGRPWTVVVCSDHGEGLGDHGESTHGYQVFDSTLRVPVLFARVEGEHTGPPEGLDRPGIEDGIELVDLLPTILSLLELPVPADLDGRDRSLAPPPRPAYVESFAAALQFGWAQTTGVRSREALLVWTGELREGGPLSPTGVPGEAIAFEGEGEAPLPSLRRALEEARRREAPAGDAALEGLAQLGYLAVSADRSRHRLRAVEDNRVLPAAPARIDRIERILEAVARLDAGEAREALDGLLALLSDDPDNPTLHFYAGRAHLRLQREGGVEQARAAAARFARSLALDPDYPGARLLEIQARGLAGDLAFAIPRALALVTDRPDDPDAQELLGSLLLERGPPGAPSDRFDEAGGYRHLVRAAELRADRRLRDRLLAALGARQAAAGAADRAWIRPLLERLSSLAND